GRGATMQCSHDGRDLSSGVLCSRTPVVDDLDECWNTLAETSDLDELGRMARSESGPRVYKIYDADDGEVLHIGETGALGRRFATWIDGLRKARADLAGTAPVFGVIARHDRLGLTVL